VGAAMKPKREEKYIKVGFGAETIEIFPTSDILGRPNRQYLHLIELRGATVTIVPRQAYLEYLFREHKANKSLNYRSWWEKVEMVTA
jgi:hypothetical protein